MDLVIETALALGAGLLLNLTYLGTNDNIVALADGTTNQAHF